MSAGLTTPQQSKLRVNGEAEIETLERETSMVSRQGC